MDSAPRFFVQCCALFLSSSLSAIHSRLPPHVCPHLWVCCVCYVFSPKYCSTHFPGALGAPSAELGAAFKVTRLNRHHTSHVSVRSPARLHRYSEPRERPCAALGAGFLQSHLAWQSLSFFVLDDIGVPENNGWQLLKHLWNVEFSNVSSWIGLGYTFSMHFWQECFMMDACLPQWFTSGGRWCHLVLLLVGDINFGRSIHSVSPRSLCCKGSISL